MLIFGVDIGGTFTDVVVFDDETGQIHTTKVPSTPANQADGFENGLDALGVDMKNVSRALHGTTVATNAAIERTGARTIGVFTKGFRDVLAIGTGQRYTGGLFNPRFTKATPLIPRSDRLELAERMSHDGTSLQAPSEAELFELLRHIQNVRADAIAVCFLHSYGNDEHEKVAVDFLRKHLPDRFICGSADVLPQVREYERFTTAAFNAYLGPVMSRYLGRLNTVLRKRGQVQELLIMTNNGGVASADKVARFPVTAVLSGPAGGISGGVFLAAQLGIGDFITYDMGGTSTDVCLVKNGQPITAPMRMVSGLPLKIPQLDINTVGAGGGSIAWVDADGRFAVGPRSAGAAPGPACYGTGGFEPTVTDANLVLNRIGSDLRLGGHISLRRELAEAAIGQLGERLGLRDGFFIAEGILRIAESNMSGAIREMSVERGVDPRSFTLIAFGGAGPMHGCAVAQNVGISRVLIPNYPGNFCALGLLTSNLRHELVRTHLTLLETADMNGIGVRIKQMIGNAQATLASESIAEQDRHIQCFLGLRYEGQAHELYVPVRPDDLDRDAIRETFVDSYRQTWSYSPANTPVQLVALKVIASGQGPQIVFPRTRASDIREALLGERDVYFEGVSRRTPLYRRRSLPPEAQLPGPAIVQEDGSTTVVLPGWHARVDEVGNLFIETR